MQIMMSNNNTSHQTKVPIKKGYSETKPKRNSSMGLSKLECRPSLSNMTTTSLPAVVSAERIHRSSLPLVNQGCSCECKAMAREFYIMKDTVQTLTQQVAMMQKLLEHHGLMESTPVSSSPTTQQKEVEEGPNEDADELLLREAMILPNEYESFCRQVSGGLPQVSLRQSNPNASMMATQAMEQVEGQRLLVVDEEEEATDSVAPLSSPHEDAILTENPEQQQQELAAGITEEARGSLDQNQEIIEQSQPQTEKDLDPMEESSPSLEQLQQEPQATTPQHEGPRGTISRRAITDNDIDHCKEDIEFLRKQMAFKYMSIMDLSDRAESAEHFKRQMPFKFKNLPEDEDYEEGDADY